MLGVNKVRLSLLLVVTLSVILLSLACSGSDNSTSAPQEPDVTSKETDIEKEPDTPDKPVYGLNISQADATSAGERDVIVQFTPPTAQGQEFRVKCGNDRERAIVLEVGTTEMTAPAGCMRLTGTQKVFVEWYQADDLLASSEAEVFIYSVFAGINSTANPLKPVVTAEFALPLTDDHFWRTNCIPRTRGVVKIGDAIRSASEAEADCTPSEGKRVDIFATLFAEEAGVVREVARSNRISYEVPNLVPVALSVDKSQISEGETVTVTVGSNGQLSNGISGTVVILSAGADWATASKPFAIGIGQAQTTLTFTANSVLTASSKIFTFTINGLSPQSEISYDNNDQTVTVFNNDTSSIPFIGLKLDRTEIVEGEKVTVKISSPSDRITTLQGTISVVPQSSTAGASLNDWADPLRSLGSGDSHTCVVRSDYMVVCWRGNLGHDDYGQANPPRSDFKSVGAGALHTCGVRIDNAVVCWGWNLFGQANSPPGEFRVVDGGRHHSCGIRTDDTVACWGDVWDDGRTIPPSGKFKSISVGEHHACGMRTISIVECWGSNEYGQSDAPLFGLL